MIVNDDSQSFGLSDILSLLLILAYFFTYLLLVFHEVQFLQSVLYSIHFNDSV
jgi:ABC-type uncharacterized transport system permease subunit